MRRITTLQPASSLETNDLLELVDVSDNSMAEAGTNKSISAQALANSLSRMITHSVDVQCSNNENAVHISQAGDGNALLVWDENPDNTPFVITKTGDVGVGTFLPTVKLDVAGEVKATSFTGNLTGNVTGTASSAGILAASRTISLSGDVGSTPTAFNGASNITIPVSLNSGVVTASKLSTGAPSWSSTGNVGVGTLPTSERLEVLGGNIRISGIAGTNNSLIISNSSGVDARLSANSNTSADLRTVGAHPLTLSTNSLERVRITSVGNVEVGTPNSALSTAINTTNTGGTQPPALTAYSPNGSTLALCANGPGIRSFGISGTLAAPTAVTDGSSLGGITGFPWNGSSFTSYGTGGTAAIYLTSKGAQTPTNGGSIITLTTTQENTVGAIERVRIDHNGNVGIGESAAITNKLTIVGDGINVKPTSYTSSYAGGIKFRNDGYAHFTAGVKGTAFVVSNTGADGNVIWPTVGQGTIDVMSIDKTGTVSTPLNPAFFAQHSIGTTSGNLMTAYSTPEFNRGSCFNPTTGRFTAPVSGIYYFSFNKLTNTGAGSAGEYRIGLNKNGNDIAGLLSIAIKPGDTGFLTLRVQGHVQLAKDDYVIVRYISGPAALYPLGNWSSFSGHLVG